MKNANHFSELSESDKSVLTDYIRTSYEPSKSVKPEPSRTAYSLKQRFTRLHHLEKHVTSRCFMEAAVFCGLDTKPITGINEPEWYIGIKKPEYPD